MEEKELECMTMQTLNFKSSTTGNTTTKMPMTSTRPTHFIAISFIFLFMCVGGFSFAQTGHESGHGKGPVVKVLSAVDATEKLDGLLTTATTFEVTLDPGVGGTPHRHPGPIFGYVAEGEFEFQAGDGPIQRLKAGDTFYEPTMALHAVSRNPSDKTHTRVIAVLLHRRDAKQLVIPEPPKQDK